jgi:DNA adenine methylase
MTAANSKRKPAGRQIESAADLQQPSIDFGDAIKLMLDTPPVKNPVAKSSFTVHRGALAEVQEPLIPDAQEKGAHPFIKWAGGKRSLLNVIKPLVPAEFNNYFENFIGGGALFYALSDRITHAYLSDNNLDLVITYQVIKADPTRLIARLKELAAGHNEDQYYAVRDEVPTDPVEVAARFIYLNKTCFNGLYRVNSSGKFNVPIGDYKNPNIADAANILACHKALQNATITYHDYRAIDPRPRDGDFVYLDSPYHPTTGDSFTAYTRENFTEQNQVELRDYAVELHRAGVKVMLSNSKTDFIKDLYGANGMDRIFTLHTVQAPRTVNCKPGGRGAVDEYLIMNY